MADTTISWDEANNRGDWVFNGPSVTQQPIALASPSIFGVGDGVASQFQLVPGKTISNVIAQIYRNDWQGNQLLYATPRTNYLVNSVPDTSAGTLWRLGSNQIRIGNEIAPDGSNTATIYQGNPSAPGNQYVVRPEGVVFTAGAQYTASVWARLVSGPAPTQGQIITIEDSLTPNHRQLVNFQGSGLSANWQRFSITFLAQAAVTGSFYLCADFGNAAQVAIWGAMLSSGPLTPYIPTVNASVTLTDYTLTPTGGVALAVPPAPGAALTWLGSYLLNTFIAGGFLEMGNDLQTAMLISLFSDRLALPGDVIPDGTDPRGWWADTDVPIGSRLWLLRRSKQTQETLQKAYDYIAESLQWLLDDQVVARFDITTQWVRTSFLGAWVIAYKQDGTVAYNGKFTWAWAGIN